MDQTKLMTARVIETITIMIQSPPPLQYFSSFVANVHKSSSYFDIFDSRYGPKASNSSFVVFDIICGECA